VVHIDICREHTASVEDIQWSPTEATVRFSPELLTAMRMHASARLDCSIKYRHWQLQMESRGGQAWMMIRFCQELRHSRQFLAAAAHDPTFVIVTLT
jgi:hypothetical protein